MPTEYQTMMRTIPFVDLQAQHRALEREMLAAVQGVLARGDFILGGAVGEFEKAFASFVGAEYAIGVSNGLDALRVVLLALDIGHGDEVILQANTFIATALAVSSVGAKVVLVDCEPGSYRIAVDQIESAITPRTRAIMPVHLTGLPADMDAINQIAQRHGLLVIEDAAQAQGARYRDRPCGSIAAAAGFSFYPGKNLGGCGDAGAITTNDRQLAARLAQYRHYGQKEKYHHLLRGLNARLDTMQAALLNVKLPHLAEWNRLRAAHAARYRELLSGVGDLTVQQVPTDCTHIYHLFIVETDRRDALQKHLGERGVQTGIHYPIPVHLQPAYADLGRGSGSFPHAERAAGRMLSLPMFPELTADQIQYVADSVREFY
jgi:dTDP-4-amino-4,6-dideoxygalactose transaminase